MHMAIVVADESEARIYVAEHADDRLQLVREISDPMAHMHDRDFKSDRPGRVFDHAPSGAGRRGAVSHHSTGGERRPREHEAGLFARRISEQLQEGIAARQFDHLIVMAAPHFLGLLRDAMPESLRRLVKAEVHKDLVHQPQDSVREHVPREAFT